MSTRGPSDDDGSLVLTRLLILWLLAEEPLHGYRIKRILDAEALRFWFPVRFGSIYSVIRSMEREGHVDALATEREGQRPERTRYAITSSGRDHLRDLLRRSWVRLPSPAEPIHAALAARPELDDEEVEDLLTRRVASLSARLEHLDELRRSAPAAEMVDRLRILTEAEVGWARGVLATSGGDRTTSPGSRQPGTDTTEDSMATQLQHPVDVQLIASLVIQRLDGGVLLVRDPGDQARWWLPGADLEAFEHPDEAAGRVLANFPGLSARTPELSHVDSFRGRRGWHVTFHYLVRATGDPEGSKQTGWFPPDGLPRMMHGRWEKEVVRRVARR